MGSIFLKRWRIAVRVSHAQGASPNMVGRPYSKVPPMPLFQAALLGAEPALNLKRRFAVRSLVTILAIALGLGWLLSHMLAQRMLQREGEVTMEFIQNLLGTDQSARFLREPENAELKQRFLTSMEHIKGMREPVRANAYRADGTVLWSTDPALIGRRYPVNDELDDALRGALVVHSGRVSDEQTSKAEHEGLARLTSYFVESYIPVRDLASGEVMGVMEFYKVPLQLNDTIQQALLQLWAACAASAGLLFMALYWTVARADTVLRAQQRQLAEAQSLMTAVDLAGAVAHNLRNPLATVRVSAEMLQLQADGGSAADVPEYCSDITQAVDRADRWITELVRVPQAQHLQQEPVSLHTVACSCLEEMASEMKRCGVAWTAPAVDTVHVLAHPAMLRQVVLSLVANALEAMPDGGSLRLDIRDQAGLGILHIADTGHGVQPAQAGQVFRPFFSTKSGGLGIGLALARRMLGQWGGAIHLHPGAGGKGTLVELTLPLAPHH